MQGRYRKADMIELHDAGIVVHVEDLPREELGWRDSPTVAGKRLSVDGNELARLLHALGMTFDADELYSEEYDVVFHRPVRTGEEKPDVPPHETLRVRELLAKAEAPHFLLIHVTTHPDDDDEREYVQELTYSGSYTVWWSTADE